MNHSFYNTGPLIKFIFKRELVRTIIWVTITVLLTVGVAAAYIDILGTEEALAGMIETMANPAMTVLVGPSYGTNLACMFAHEMLLFTIILVAVMNIFLVVSHTRKDEELGRLEVIRSLPSGRLTSLSATLIVSFIVNIILTVLIALGLAMLNINGMTIGASWLYGVILGLSGFMFAAIAAIFVQLSASAKGAIGYSMMTLGVSYIVRGIGDVSSEIISLISPLGLPLRTAVFAENNWWPIFIMLAITIVCTITAFYLNATRDLGAGLIPARKGRNHAKRSLLSPFGLAWKLLKVSTFWWALTVFIFGVTYGSIFGDIEKFLESSEMIKQMFLNNPTFTIQEQFMSIIMVIMAIISTIPVITTIMRIRKEETEGRLEHIISRNVSRTEMLGCYLIIAIFTSVLLMVLTSLGIWVAAAAVMSETISITTALAAGLVHVPAMLIMIGITMVLIAYVPKYTSVIWGYLGFSFISVYFGDLLKLPEFIVRLSPFGNVPKLPVDSFNLVTMIILGAISIALMIIGFIGYNRRDIAS